LSSDFNTQPKYILHVKHLAADENDYYSARVEIGVHLRSSFFNRSV